MVTARSPVHSALWFATVVLASSGLFLLLGAPFLAAGTVIVYAGAIIVTFLFVIMLAQAEGIAPYDRASRSPGRATLTAFLLLWSILYCIATLSPAKSRVGTSGGGLASLSASMVGGGVAEAGGVSTSRLDASAPHVAALGATLYTDYLIAAELVGVLLFVALVGAAVIATPKAPVRPAARLVFGGSEVSVEGDARRHQAKI
jgi:NADH-quinone oxidoreductase subunit J